MGMKYLILLFATILPSLARAEEPLPKPDIVAFPEGEDIITPLRKGEAAPHAGQLFEENTALRWAFFMQQYKLRYGLDLKAARESCTVLVARESVYRSIESSRNREVEADLRKRLLAAEKARLEAEEKLRNPPFWKEPGFWYGTGVVTTVVAVVAVVYATNE